MTQEISSTEIASSIESPQTEVPASEPESNEQASQSEQESAQTEESQASEEKKVQEDPDFVRRFNALTRREREILQKEQSFREKASEFEQYAKERDLVKKDPLTFLKNNGWEFNDLADYVLNDKKESPDRKVAELEKRIEEMKAEREREIQEKSEREKREKEQQTITAYKKSIKETITSKESDYELVNAFDEYDTVYDVIESYYNQHGVILETEKAAAEVEKHLEKLYEKASSTNKFRKRFTPIEQEQAATRKPPQQEVQEPTRTLTNDTSTYAPAQQTQESSYLSEEDSKARAAEILREHFLKKKGYTKT